jgi:NifU-like protein
MEELRPEWDTLCHEEKIARIKAVIDLEIAPLLLRDGGGLDFIDLVDGKEVIVAYRGACASCPMALCGTLGFIQQVISSQVHPSLVVTPKF